MEPPVPPLYTALRLLGALVLVLMLVAIGYASWIAAVNWSHISV